MKLAWWASEQDGAALATAVAEGQREPTEVLVHDRRRDVFSGDTDSSVAPGPADPVKGGPYHFQVGAGRGEAVGQGVLEDQPGPLRVWCEQPLFVAL